MLAHIYIYIILYIYIPGEPKTFILGGYDPYIEGLKPSFFMVLGSKGVYIYIYIQYTYIYHKFKPNVGKYIIFTWIPWV